MNLPIIKSQEEDGVTTQRPLDLIEKLNKITIFNFPFSVNIKLQYQIWILTQNKEIILLCDMGLSPYQILIGHLGIFVQTQTWAIAEIQSRNRCKNWNICSSNSIEFNILDEWVKWMFLISTFRQLKGRREASSENHYGRVQKWCVRSNPNIAPRLMPDLAQQPPSLQFNLRTNIFPLVPSRPQ